MRLWTVRKRELHNMVSMVEVEKLVIPQERRRLGANRLLCIDLNQTRRAYFGTNDCRKVKNKFPLLHFVPTYIRLHWHHISLASSNFSSFLLLCSSVNHKQSSKKGSGQSLVRWCCIEPYWCMMHSLSHGWVMDHYCEAWCTASGHRLMPAQHWAILCHNDAWCTALNHTDARCTSLSRGYTACIEPYWATLMPDTQH